MTAKAMTPAQSRKRRYNATHRLRTAGVEVDVKTKGIQINCGEYEDLDLKALRYIRTLRDEYGFVLQTRIPVPRTEPGAVRHRRRKGE